MIHTEGLRVSYRAGWRRSRLEALAGLDLRVEAGECVGLLGHNGAGKSTALGCFLGLIRPTAGRVAILGQTPAAGAELFRHVGYLPEEPVYHGHLTVREALTYYGRLQGVVDVEAASAPLLERLDMARWRDLMVSRCSKGMKQKLGIVQCLLHAPRLLLLDEPMRGLDPVAVMAFRELLADANRAGTTIVMSSHLLGEVEQLARRVVILDRGRLVADGTVASLTRHREARYDVAIAATETWPPEIDGPVAVDGEVRGTVAPAALHGFFDRVRADRLTLISCALERASLEEAYMSIVGDARRGEVSHG
ncbi:MAG: ABC transporter ATP-binding protein [Vicinamibacteraceae bacterium]